MDLPGVSPELTARVAAARKGKRGKGRNYKIPNPKSTPKEIAGKHGHRPHGTSILWPALYEHLKAKGMTKSKAAQISNGMWRKKRGLPPKSVPGTKGKVKVAGMSSGGRSLTVAAREKAAEAEAALPDGKLPTRNKEELKAAVALRGKVKGHSQAEIKAYLVRRAKALGATDVLPSFWMKNKDGK
jgi:hypothetical protein